MFGIGEAIGGIASAFGAAQQRKFEARQAQKQMDFQERMSSTSWQRGVQDMRAAGINPMLAFQQGGASSPVGAMASGGESPVSAGVSTALQVRALKQQMMRTQADIGIKAAQAALLNTRNINEAAGIQFAAGGPVTSFEVLRRQAAVDALKAGIELTNSARALNAAALPAAKVEGSAFAGRLRLGVSSASQLARAVGDVVGGVKRGPPTINRTYNIQRR